jgi:hypothetical protein
MAKLIQICASQNDLFGLDAEGVVHHYNFNTNTWVRLGHGQRNYEGSPGSEGEPTIPHSEVTERAGGRDIEPLPRRPT